MQGRIAHVPEMETLGFEGFSIDLNIFIRYSAFEIIYRRYF